MRGPLPTHCHHGKTWAEECIECDLQWHRDMLAIAEQSAAKHRAAIDRLNERLQDVVRRRVKEP